MVFLLQMQEEETARLQAAKRRLQRELDELTEQNEQLQRDIARKGYDTQSLTPTHTTRSKPVGLLLCMCVKWPVK